MLRVTFPLVALDKIHVIFFFSVNQYIKFTKITKRLLYDSFKVKRCPRTIKNKSRN